MLLLLLLLALAVSVEDDDVYDPNPVGSNESHDVVDDDDDDDDDDARHRMSPQDRPGVAQLIAGRNSLSEKALSEGIIRAEEASFDSLDADEEDDEDEEDGDDDSKW